MMKSLAETFQPHVWVNVHSGMEALFLPYDHRAQVLHSKVRDQHCRLQLDGAAVYPWPVKLS